MKTVHRSSVASDGYAIVGALTTVGIAVKATTSLDLRIGRRVREGSYMVISSSGMTYQSLRSAESFVEAVSPRMTGRTTTKIGRSNGNRFVIVVVARDDGSNAASKKERPVPIAALRTARTATMATLTVRFPLLTRTSASFTGGLSLGCCRLSVA